MIRLETSDNSISLPWYQKLLNISNIGKTAKNNFYWNLTVSKNFIQGVLTIFAIIFPWYRFYYRRNAFKVFDAGAFNMGGQVVGFLLIICFLSFFQIFMLIFYSVKKKKEVFTLNRIVEFFTIYPGLIVLSFLGDPVFMPGLGDGLYSDYIRLHTLNWAGYQIVPMFGYISVLVVIGLSCIGALLVIFAPSSS